MTRFEKLEDLTVHEQWRL